MKRILAVLPIALMALGACSSNDEAPNSLPGPASSYTPGSPGAPARSNEPATRSGLGNDYGGAGTNGIPTNPAQGE